MNIDIKATLDNFLNATENEQAWILGTLLAFSEFEAESFARLCGSYPRDIINRIVVKG